LARAVLTAEQARLEGVDAKVTEIQIIVRVLEREVERITKLALKTGTAAEFEQLAEAWEKLDSALESQATLRKETALAHRNVMKAAKASPTTAATSIQSIATNPTRKSRSRLSTPTT
jgi:hypothetical protein